MDEDLGDYSGIWPFSAKSSESSLRLSDMSSSPGATVPPSRPIQPGSSTSNPSQPNLTVANSGPMNPASTNPIQLVAQPKRRARITRPRKKKEVVVIPDDHEWEKHWSLHDRHNYSPYIQGTPGGTSIPTKQSLQGKDFDMWELNLSDIRPVRGDRKTYPTSSTVLSDWLLGHCLSTLPVGEIYERYPGDLIKKGWTPKTRMPRGRAFKGFDEQTQCWHYLVYCKVAELHGDEGVIFKNDHILDLSQKSFPNEMWSYGKECRVQSDEALPDQAHLGGIWPEFAEWARKSEDRQKTRLQNNLPVPTLDNGVFNYRQVQYTSQSLKASPGVKSEDEDKPGNSRVVDLEAESEDLSLRPSVTSPLIPSVEENLDHSVHRSESQSSTSQEESSTDGESLDDYTNLTLLHKCQVLIGTPEDKFDSIEYVFSNPDGDDLIHALEEDDGRLAYDLDESNGPGEKRIKPFQYGDPPKSYVDLDALRIDVYERAPAVAPDSTWTNSPHLRLRTKKDHLIKGVSTMDLQIGKVKRTVNRYTVASPFGEIFALEWTCAHRFLLYNFEVTLGTCEVRGYRVPDSDISLVDMARLDLSPSGELLNPVHESVDSWLKTRIEDGKFRFQTPTDGDERPNKPFKGPITTLVHGPNIAPGPSTQSTETKTPRKSSKPPKPIKQPVNVDPSRYLHLRLIGQKHILIGTLEDAVDCVEYLFSDNIRAITYNMADIFCLITLKERIFDQEVPFFRFGNFPSGKYVESDLIHLNVLKSATTQHNSSVRLTPTLLSLEIRSGWKTEDQRSIILSYPRDSKTVMTSRYSNADEAVHVIPYVSALDWCLKAQDTVPSALKVKPFLMEKNGSPLVNLTDLNLDSRGNPLNSPLTISVPKSLPLPTTSRDDRSTLPLTPNSSARKAPSSASGLSVNWKLQSRKILSPTPAPHAMSRPHVQGELSSLTPDLIQALSAQQEFGREIKARVLGRLSKDKNSPTNPTQTIELDQPSRQPIPSTFSDQTIIPSPIPPPPDHQRYIRSVQDEIKPVPPSQEKLKSQKRLSSPSGNPSSGLYSNSDSAPIPKRLPEGDVQTSESRSSPGENSSGSIGTVFDRFSRRPHKQSRLSMKPLPNNSEMLTEILQTFYSEVLDSESVHLGGMERVRDQVDSLAEQDTPKGVMEGIPKLYKALDEANRQASIQSAGIHRRLVQFLKSKGLDRPAATIEAIRFERVARLNLSATQ
ncbi:hypothetical protein MMC20_002116 [Loxospora ochrophaea]|nr:hypothetical protein [Loxospora ochrophaea]